jgi:hypothetical protein
MTTGFPEVNAILCLKITTFEGLLATTEPAARRGRHCGGLFFGEAAIPRADALGTAERFATASGAVLTRLEQDLFVLFRLVA